MIESSQLYTASVAELRASLIEAMDVFETVTGGNCEISETVLNHWHGVCVTCKGDGEIEVASHSDPFGTGYKDIPCPFCKED